MTALSSVLAWRIPWTEEPGGLQSIGSQRVEHDWGTEHACPQLVTHMSNPGAPVLWLPNERLSIISPCPLPKLPKWWLAEALKNIDIYLFIWLHQVLVAAWRILDLHCDMQNLFILGWELLDAAWIQFHVLYSVMCTWLFKFIFLKYSWFYNILISAVQQSDSVIHRYTFFFIFFSIMIYPRILNIAPHAIQEDLVVYLFSI